MNFDDLNLPPCIPTLPPIKGGRPFIQLPLYGEIVPRQPVIYMRHEDLLSAKMPEPIRIKVKLSKCVLIGGIWDKKDRMLHILIPWLHIEIPFKEKKHEHTMP
jgi:hypothetical protein